MVTKGEKYKISCCIWYYFRRYLIDGKQRMGVQVRQERSKSTCLYNMVMSFLCHIYMISHLLAIHLRG